MIQYYTQIHLASSYEARCICFTEDKVGAETHKMCAAAGILEDIP